MLLFFRFTQGKMKEHTPGTTCAQNAQTDIKLCNWKMSAIVLLDGWPDWSTNIEFIKLLYKEIRHYAISAVYDTSGTEFQTCLYRKKTWNHINIQRVRITKDLCFRTQTSTYCCTIVCCGDASISHKMKLAVIGKTKKMQSLRTLKKLHTCQLL